MILGGKSERTSSFVLRMMNGVTLLCSELSAKSLLVDSAEPFFEYLQGHTSMTALLRQRSTDVLPCRMDSASVLAHEISSRSEESRYQEIKQRP